jgi:4-hydroxybenzoate polyprenyltransferase
MQSKYRQFVRLARPHQYIKNGFIWLPLFFGYKLTDPQAIVQTFFAFCVFCLLASSLYVYNDIRDAAEDRHHPVKKNRPLASGGITPAEAVVFFSVLLVLAFALAYLLLPLNLLVVLAAYTLLNVAYSTFLKHRAIVDVTCIAIGFVLRVFVGGMATNLQISHWIVIVTFLLALFLALAKRRDDLLLVSNGLRKSRHSLDGYNLEFISNSMMVMASVIIVAYVLYTVSPGVIAKHGTDKLYLTSLWVVLGLLRYLQITFVKQRSGSPTMVLLKDYVLQAIVGLWLLTYYLLLYGSAG